MKITIKKATLKASILTAMLLLSAFIILTLIGVPLLTKDTFAANQTTVATFVNVTNSNPRILSVFVEDSITSPENEIDLTAGSTTFVNCTASYFDFGGWNDSNTINATGRFIANTSTYDAVLDNNTHYRNTSCKIYQTPGGGSGNGTAECTFKIWYFANDTNWTCFINVSDANFSARANDSALINQLLALGTPANISYGSLVVAEVSSSVPLNVTNYGNVVLNYSLRGYGGDNPNTPGVNLSAMICPYGNISIGYERWGTIDGQALLAMTNLTGSVFTAANVTINQRTNDSTVVVGEDINTSYWRLEIPLDVGGFCNGSIVFRAEKAEV